MAASKQWTKEAADVFLAFLGKTDSLELLRRLRQIESANKSARETIQNLRDEIRSRKA